VRGGNLVYGLDSDTANAWAPYRASYATSGYVPLQAVSDSLFAVNDTGETAMHAAAYRGANTVVQYLFDKGAKLDVVALDGRTPLQVADGVEYGNSFAANPHTAVLLRKLGAKEIPCPDPCEAVIPIEKFPEEALR